jgi:hypothetical protein
MLELGDSSSKSSTLSSTRPQRVLARNLQLDCHFSKLVIEIDTIEDYIINYSNLTGEFET